jgi:hypothetical protein
LIIGTAEIEEAISILGRVIAEWKPGS